ncbi:MAG TPA: stalk domain-containing protein [Caldisericia bacterium]|nr:stalk domain-containing protein [Caldisericia bacterium]
MRLQNLSKTDPSYLMRHRSSFHKYFLSLLCIMTLFISLLLPVFADTPSLSYRFYGWGPLEGESGMPVAAQLLGADRIAVLDLLKSSIIFLDTKGSYLSSFSIDEKLFDLNKAFSFRTSPDGFLFLQAQESLLVFSDQGKLLQKLPLTSIPGYQSGLSKILPISSKQVLLYHPVNMQFVMISLQNPSQSISFPYDASQQHFLDFTCTSEFIVILGQYFNHLNQRVPSITLLSYQGEFIKRFDLPSSILTNPARISVNTEASFFVLDEVFNYLVLDPGGAMSETGKITVEDEHYLSRNFCSFGRNTLFLPHIKKGLMEFSNSTLTRILLPVKSEGQKLLAPISVTANGDFVASYDSLAERFVIFQKDQILRSFFKKDLPFSIDQNAQISLYAGRQWLYIAISDSSLKLIKYDPINGKISLIALPEYISARSTVYVRPHDNQLFIYSWFDSILYIMTENSETPEKIQVRRHESSALSQQSICKVDDSGNIFILLPYSNRMNVFAKDGSLLFSFSPGKKPQSMMVDFHFMDDYLVLLDQTYSSIEILSKRGEWIQSIGEKGAILYPAKNTQYHQQEAFFQYPSSVFCYFGDIYVADTCNSRIQTITYPGLSQKTMIELQVGSPSAYINGKRIQLDAPPFIEAGRTLVPLRFIGEAFGAKVAWIAEQNKAVISLGQKTIEVTIGSKTALVNGKEHSLDVAAKISQGRTFVPLRFIGEAFGASIVWESESKRIILTYPGY